jgi:LysR family hydrogen peroxide-inducible transcriptional activator
MAGDLDAAIVALEAELGDVERDVIAVDPFLLATRPDDPIGNSPEVATAKDLAGASVLLLDDGHCFRDQALGFCASAGARELSFRATSLPTLVQMVAGGRGVTLLPALSVPTETARAAIAIREFADPAPFRTVALVWRKGAPLGAALRDIADAVRQAYPAKKHDRRASRH